MDLHHLLDKDIVQYLLEIILSSMVDLNWKKINLKYVDSIKDPLLALVT